MPSQFFSSSIADESFKYSASLKNQSDLPEWLVFSSENIFNAAPGADDIGFYEIMLKGTTEEPVQIYFTYFSISVLDALSEIIFEWSLKTYDEAMQMLTRNEESEFNQDACLQKSCDV